MYVSAKYRFTKKEIPLMGQAVLGTVYKMVGTLYSMKTRQISFNTASGDT